jgi:hypothetical protein
MAKLRKDGSKKEEKKESGKAWSEGDEKQKCCVKSPLEKLPLELCF